MRESQTGTAHKVVSVILRFGEFACAVIVLGILGRFSYLINLADANVNGRIIYTMVVAGMGIIYSILFCPPFKTLFLGFPFDFILFVMWLVAYCLLQTETRTHTCSAAWFNNYWGYYWGHFWGVRPVGTVNVNGAGCSEWRTVLAFSFIAWLLHLFSGILGAYVFHQYIKLDETRRDFKNRAEKFTRAHPRGHGNVQAHEAQTGATNTQSAVPTTTV